MVIGIYSNLYYPTRWVPLKRIGYGWARCNDLFQEHSCLASCGRAGKNLEIVLDIKGCNLRCKFCWGYKMRYLHEGIKKGPIDVVRDICCRINEILKDKYIRKKKVKYIRITGNEPLLQWKHLIQVLNILNDEDKLKDICIKNKFNDDIPEMVRKCKIVIETNGTIAKHIDLEPLLNIDLKMDFDVSFKGVNENQFSWLSSMPKKFFDYQIDGFVKLFDFFEENSLEKIRANPVLGINHAENYCFYKNGKKYVVDVEIVDENGKRIDFHKFSKRFEEEVLSRKWLRFDEAPFREYFGINKETTRLVVATIYKGKRYLHVLPSEIPEIVKE